MNERICATYQDDLLGLIEESLEPSVEAELRDHLDQCPTCANEYRWLRAACTDLESLGAEWAKQAPPIDLVDGVMEMVARVKEVRPHPVALVRESTRRRLPWTGWASLAAGLAAACFILWVAVFSPVQRSAQQAPGTIAKTSAEPSHVNRPMHLASSKQTRMSETALQELQKVFDPKRGAGSRKADNAGSKSPEMAETKPLTVDELLALRKQSIDNSDARKRLSLWATITDAKARELAKETGVSIEAKVGLIDSLTPDEAETVLLAAIEAFPDDPYLHKELADVYSSQPGNEAKANAQLQELNRLDPNNAYASFKMASNMFTQGDLDAAKLALEQAQAQERVDAYTRSAAKSYELALEAAGMSSDAAEAATALSAGTSEYSDLVNLGNNLLQVGRNLDQQGDSELARQVIEAVQQLGEMTVRNALFSAEWLAGLDVQSAAITVFGETSMAQTEAQTLSDLAQQMHELVAAYNELAAYYNSLDDFFAGNVTQTLFLLLASLILQNGDLNALPLVTQK